MGCASFLFTDSELSFGTGTDSRADSRLAQRKTKLPTGRGNAAKTEKDKDSF
jgi:hypothetical protein